MECPMCGKKAYVVTKIRGAATLVGAGAGGMLLLLPVVKQGR